MADGAAPPRRPSRSRVLAVLGVCLLAFAVLGIAHFVFSAARASFPDVTVSAPRHWVVFALHAVSGAASLILLWFARR